MTTLIRGGTVISPISAQPLDVLIDGERVVALLAPGDTSLGSDLSATADRVIDATGKYVVPGGVDAHTHMELPFGGTFASDTFETGTRAAAYGGTTTIVDFAVQRTGERVQDGLAAWHEKARGECAIDYGFHQIIGGVDDDSLKAMDELVNEGITSFKLFMAYPGVFLSDDGQIVRAMQTASENGAMIMMHAENGSAIDVLVSQALARGDTAPRYHGLTRPWETEEEATHRAIMLAHMTGAPLYIVHMSAKQAVETLAVARGKGWNVFGETCPQYLYLSLEEHLSAPGFEGAKWVCSTPLRARAEGHQDELWRCLRTGDLSVVSTTPARMVGLHPRKGELIPGADADVVIYDPNARTRISLETAHMNMDHSAWEGTEISGGVDTVLSRGQVIVERGTYLGSKGHGQFLRRGLSTYLS